MNYHDNTEEEDLPAQIADLAQASAPTSLKGMRACKRCGILKTLDQFITEGCENCPFLEMVSIFQKNTPTSLSAVLNLKPRQYIRSYEC